MSSYESYEEWRERYESDEEAARVAHGLLVMKSFEVIYLRGRLQMLNRFIRENMRPRTKPGAVVDQKESK